MITSHTISHPNAKTPIKPPVQSLNTMTKRDLNELDFCFSVMGVSAAGVFKETLFQ